MVPNETNTWVVNTPESCPAVMAIDLISGKWKPMILHMLTEGTFRFGELRRNIPSISQKMLTQQLRQLEADGLIGRRVYAEVPPKVEYSLTPVGRQLEPILNQLYAWGETYSVSQTATEQ